MSDVALITGARRGLGSALYHTFHDHGWYCIVNCRATDSCENMTEMLSDTTYHECGDLKDPWIINRLGQIAASKGVKVLINNAGIYRANNIGDMSVDELRAVHETNLIAPMLLTKAVWPTLRETGGIVVNINSLAGKNGGRRELAYCASKYGLAGFSSSLQYDATSDNVRVLDVFLGAMDTDMMSGRTEESDKLIDTMEVARVIYDLCRDYPSMRITEVTIARRRY